MTRVLTLAFVMPWLVSASSPWCDKINSAAVLFVGTVSETHPSSEFYSTDDTGRKAHYVATTFRVSEAFLGTRDGELLTVLTVRRSQFGDEVFVDGYRAEDARVRENCNCGSMVVVDDGGLLAFLRRNRAGHGDPASLRVYSQDFGPPGGTVVRIGGAASQARVFQGPGPVEFENLTPGRYAVAAARAGFEMPGGPYVVDILPHSCPAIDVKLRRTDGSSAGQMKPDGK